MVPGNAGGKGGPPDKKGFVALLEKKKILTGVPPATEADLERVKKLLDASPDSKDLIEWYAFLLYTLNKIKECLKVYSRLINGYEPSAEALYYYGCAHLKDSNFRAANAAWTMLKKKHPDSGMVSRVSQKQEVLRELVGVRKKKKSKAQPQLAIKGLLKNIGNVLKKTPKKKKKKPATPKPTAKPAPEQTPPPKPSPLEPKAPSPIDRLSILDKFGTPMSSQPAPPPAADLPPLPPLTDFEPAPPKPAADLPPLPPLDFKPTTPKPTADLPPLPSLDDFAPKPAAPPAADLPPLPSLDDFQPKPSQPAADLPPLPSLEDFAPSQPEPAPEPPAPEPEPIPEPEASPPREPTPQQDSFPAMLGAEKDDSDDASPASLLDHFLASVGPDDWGDDELMTPPEGMEAATPVDMNELEQTAYMHLGKGELDQAKEVYEKILSLDEKHPIALFYLGDIMYSKGKDSKAKGFWNKLVQQHPQHELAKKAERTLALINATTF